jgi:ribosomal protein S18 acetylase RimI-like enzyme
MTGYFDAAPRSLRPEDAHSTRDLLIATLGFTPYIDRALEVLEVAERGGNNDENRALIIERDGTVAGIALFGFIAGAEGAARIHAIAVAPTLMSAEVGARLLDAVVDALRKDRARFVLAEFPADPAIAGSIALLKENGFVEEARIPDFYRDGTDLTFLRRPL